jgi:glycosyltransferase involved in cell wall biosynthesis
VCSPAVAATLAARGPFFLLVTALRPVKDPAYVLEAFAAWRATASTSTSTATDNDNDGPAPPRLVIVGPALDTALAASFPARCESLAGVAYLGAVARAEVGLLALGAAAVCNTSRSEGMSGALLDAMAAGRPVIARRNGGNEALIEHQVTGLLFDDPAGFVSAAQVR